MSSFDLLKKYLMLFAIVQVLGLANVHADQAISHRGGGGEHQHPQGHSRSHSQYQHHQDMHHPSYGEAEGHRTGVFIAPQGDEDQNSSQQSQPDNPLYDAESQQLQQQGQ